MILGRGWPGVRGGSSGDISAKLLHQLDDLIDRAGRGVGDDPAIAQGQQAVRVDRRLRSVGDHHHGLLELVDGLPKQAQYVLGRLRIQVAGRLVGKDDGGTRDQRAGHGDPLLLAAGELGRQVVAAVLQPDRREQLIEPLLVRLPAGNRQRQDQVLLGRQDGQQVEELEDEAELVAAQLRQVSVVELGDVGPVDQDPATGRAIEPGEHMEQGGLPRAGRAHDRREAVALELHAHVTQRVDRGVTFPVAPADVDRLDDAAAAQRRFCGSHLRVFLLARRLGHPGHSPKPRPARKLAIRVRRRPYWMTPMWAEETIRGRSGLAPGSEFAGFRIERTLGQGGMGIVYLTRQVRLDRLVALKVIRPELAEDEHFRARFESESRTAASIEDPRVVAVFGAGERNGLLYVSMQYVAGRDLGRLISAKGALPPEDAADLIAQVGDGLDAVHAAGLVHRDVKPANVLVGEPERFGDERAAFLTDFGLAKIAASTTGLTATGEVIGTIDYMAPEQIEARRVDARTDVYALGCVLFHAVTGRVPFPERESSSKMWAHLNEPPPAADRPARVLDPVIRRAMAKDPGDRFPSAGDLGRAALAATRGEAVTEPEHAVGTGEAALAETVPLAVTAPTERQPRRRRTGRGRKSRFLIPLLTTLIAAGLTFTALLVVPKLNDSSSPPRQPSGITVPSLAGQRLNVAEQRLTDLGLQSNEVGGGLFGVLVPSDWEGCRSSPAADATVRRGSTVQLSIDRPGSC